jgi:cytochrome P450
MTQFDEAIDYFTDTSLTPDPYPYLDYLSENRPVWREPHHGVVLVTGYEEACAVYRDTATFSSCNFVAGPEPKFPVPLEGDDISDIIEQYRDQLPQNDQLPSFDPPKHTAQRALIMGLITPKRLKENESFMWRLADRSLDQILPPSECEIITDYAKPYTLLVVADLLGVPESDHPLLLSKMGFGAMPGTSRRQPMLGTVGQDTSGSDSHGPEGYNTLQPLYEYFVEALEDRRRQPRDDVLTGMALATFPDGTLPDTIEAARIASNLFAAGQETTVRLLGAALQRIADDQELQQLLRERRELISNFVEETLRFEGPVKGDFRMARKTTTLAGVDLPAGTTLLLMNGAASRDPRRFECPAEFRVERSNARQHLAFGHGIHTCPGAPLARSEGRVTIERLFDRTSDLRISEASHGPAGARRWDYMPTYMFRALNTLHLEYTPIG